jgi:hypothetical protein
MLSWELAFDVAQANPEQRRGVGVWELTAFEHQKRFVTSMPHCRGLPIQEMPFGLMLSVR